MRRLPESRSRGRSARSTKPSWQDVEELIDRLAVTGETFATALAPNNRIVDYQRGRRLMLDSSRGSRWIAVENIRECFGTFERLGRIQRQDVLDPGRCSAFMVALFAQLPGVVEHRAADEHYLVLPS